MVKYAAFTSSSGEGAGTVAGGPVVVGLAVVVGAAVVVGLVVVVRRGVLADVVGAASLPPLQPAAASETAARKVIAATTRFGP